MQMIEKGNIHWQGRQFMGTPRLINRNNIASGQITEAANQANRLSEILRLTVARGTCYFLDPTRALRIFLTVSEAHTAAAAGAQTFTPTSRVARVPDVSGGVTWPVNGGPAGGATGTNSDGAFQQVFRDLNGVSAVVGAVNDDEDAGADTIAYTAALDGAHTVFYVTSNPGQLVISIEDPRGLARLSYPIFEGDTRVLAKMNQFIDHSANVASFPDVDGSQLPIPEDFDIVFYLKAAFTVGWNAPFTSNNNFAVTDIPAYSVPYNQMPAGTKEYVRGRIMTLAR